MTSSKIPYKKIFFAFIFVSFFNLLLLTESKSELVRIGETIQDSNSNIFYVGTINRSNNVTFQFRGKFSPFIGDDEKRQKAINAATTYCMSNDGTIKVISYESSMFDFLLPQNMGIVNFECRIANKKIEIAKPVSPKVPLPEPVSPPETAQGSSGTAFRIAPGQFVTNHHVVENCKTMVVGGKQGGSVLEIDPKNDLALISVPNDSGETASIRTTRTVLNEAVTAAGFPLQGAFSGIAITNGTVSRLSGLQGDTGQIQISAPVQPGNSGGPLVDSAGNVIGVVSGKLNALKVAGAIGDIPQNINFAIGGNILRAFLDEKGINYKEAGREEDLRGEKIAALASSFTVLVECK